MGVSIMEKVSMVYKDLDRVSGADKQVSPVG
jgi:hypothetical protein